MEKLRAKEYFLKVIRSRKAIIRSGHSGINTQMAWNIINRLELLLNTYHYNEKQMNKFWLS